MSQPSIRRQMLAWAALGAGSLLVPPSVWAALKTPKLTEGPFYPGPKDLPLDQDNNLTIIAGKSGVAVGILLDVTGRVVDEKDRPMKSALWKSGNAMRTGATTIAATTTRLRSIHLSRASAKPSPMMKAAIDSVPFDRSPTRVGCRIFISK